MTFRINTFFSYFSEVVDSNLDLRRSVHSKLEKKIKFMSCRLVEVQSILVVTPPRPNGTSSRASEKLVYLTYDDTGVRPDQKL